MTNSHTQTLTDAADMLELDWFVRRRTLSSLNFTFDVRVCDSVYHTPHTSHSRQFKECERAHNYGNSRIILWLLDWHVISISPRSLHSTPTLSLSAHKAQMIFYDRQKSKITSARESERGRSQKAPKFGTTTATMGRETHKLNCRRWFILVFIHFVFTHSFFVEELSKVVSLFLENMSLTAAASVGERVVGCRERVISDVRNTLIHH
jgi:hypothetical protein